ncbi:MAG: leucine--tRNA ligase [Mycoplasmoidaceae bacterium]
MYDHIKTEKKWAKYWIDNKTFKFKNNFEEKKFYVLDMFPYPSGSGLHVGHPKGYTASDIVSRFKRLQGYNVLHPIGWDAFGLPAEQYAIQTGNHPKEFTKNNIDNFRKQLQRLGYDYDYEKEVCTSDENYYKWTQWIFTQFYKNGLAEIKDIDVNWCENLKIVLSNEEIIKNNDGKFVSERGGFPIIKRKMKQWVLKITKFSETLLSGLDDVNWNDNLKNIQRKWIGKKEGSLIKFYISGRNEYIPVFTDKIETIYGASFIALSPESDVFNFLFKVPSQKIAQFISSINNTKDFERTKLNSEKFGLKTDIYCVNPINSKIIPVFLVNYVLPYYGTGAIMGVPSHDENDKNFSEKYNINKIEVFNQNNISINCDEFNGLCKDDLRCKIIKKLINQNNYEPYTIYKLKDWLFSRQRYWGEPFPILYDKKGNISIDENLPITLPEISDFTPDKNGNPPLNKSLEWVNITKNNIEYRRDLNTMPQWAGSSWYYIAYILKQDDNSYLDLNSPEAKKLINHWLPVDLYIGGQEHAVLHLLYARFWHQFLCKIGITDIKEPFFNVINQGMILDNNGNKISKSVGNVISVDEICNKYGADTLRLYEMFMGPIIQTSKWSEKSVSGIRNFLNKIYKIYKEKEFVNDSQILEYEYNEMLLNTTYNIENINFNIAITKMMVFIKSCSRKEKLNLEYMENFLIILSCFCPFISQEIYTNILNKKGQLALKKWPSYVKSNDEKKIMNLPIQINGKVKSIISIKLNEDEESILNKVYSSDKIKKYILNKVIIKHIYVKNKILNIITK